MDGWSKDGNENTERKDLIIMSEARQEGGENWRNYVNKKKVKEKKKGLIEKPMEKIRMEDRKEGWNK